MNKKTFINKLYRTICIALLGLIIYTGMPLNNYSDFDADSTNNLISICSDDETIDEKFTQ